MANFPLLPYEKEIAKLIGVSEPEYSQWKAFLRLSSVARPAKAGISAGPLIVPALTNLAISAGLTLLSSLLFPQQARPNSRISVRRTTGGGRVENQRLSPRFGFDSIQEPATVGQIIPIVIAKREDGLGGVRVSMPMVWSQVLARNGSLMFRGIYLAGLNNMPANAWDPRGWAFGNNTLGAYDYDPAIMAEGGRYSIYYNCAGGRITSAHLIAGRKASGDPGNFENAGAEDVFSVATNAGVHEKIFSVSEGLSTSATFGLYGWCPNAMMYRANIQIQPTIVARIDQDDKIRTDDDPSALVEIWKGKFRWSTHSGLRHFKPAGSSSWSTPAGDFGVERRDVFPGDMLKYTLAKATDSETIIRFDRDNSRIVDNDASADEQLRGIAAAVTGMQNAADSFLVTGELFRIGSCWAVLQERIPENPNQTAFVSDSEQEPTGGGSSMDYVFTVVRPGTVHFVGYKLLDPPENSAMIKPPEYNPNNDLAALSSGTENRYRVCSGAAQIFRMAIASVGSVREFKVCELVIKSRVGITVNGMTGFSGCEKIEKINERAGQKQVGKTANGLLTAARYDSSGSLVSARTKRYSSFLFQYSADRGATWSEFPEVFAIAGISGEDQYTYLRMNFPSLQRWERRLVPISSWEIRDRQISRVVVLDPGGSVVSSSAGGVTLSTTGYIVNPTDDSVRKISVLEPRVDIGLGWSDQSPQSMFDGYARFAEGFCYAAMQTSAGSAPEHEIVHVNYFDSASPSYEGMVPVGVNISASEEFRSLQSFSGFCDNGYEMPRLLNQDSKGATHLWPDWFRELSTNPALGASPALGGVQIDAASFRAAAQWCQDRKYFYDTIEDTPLNLLEWAEDVAQAHLLKVVESGNVYRLEKAIEFDAPLHISALFTNGNIIEESFGLKSPGRIERQPFIVQVKWREESTNAAAPLFPRVRAATVRASSTSVNAPVRVLDLSKWCTNYRQAIDAACYLIRFNELGENDIQFQTTPDLLGSGIKSGDIISVSMDVESYGSEFQGFIQDDGTIVCTRIDSVPLQDGSYQALVWNSTMNGDPQKSTVVVQQGRGEPAGCFFALSNTRDEQRTYEISKLTIDHEGVVSVTAFHHPTDESGYSLMGKNWTTYQTDQNWVIDL